MGKRIAQGTEPRVATLLQRLIDRFVALAVSHEGQQCGYPAYQTIMHSEALTVHPLSQVPGSVQVACVYGL
ncbi:MAG: hypothetical protein V3U31_07700, partial [Dehalococcoidia bacterium]